MKLHLPSSLRRALMTAMSVAAGGITLFSGTVEAGILRYDYQTQDYLDFAYNLGKFTAGRHNIPITKTDGTAGPSIPVMPQLSAYIHMMIGGSGLVAPQYVNSAAHVGKDAGFARILARYQELTDSGYVYSQTGYSKYTRDAMTVRLNKIVTESNYIPYSTDTSFLSSLAKNGTWIYRLGNGMQSIISANGSVSVFTAHGLLGGTIKANSVSTTSNGCYVITSYLKNSGNPLPINTDHGDSGSPAFAYNPNTKRWEYVGACSAGSTSAGGWNSFGLWVYSPSDMSSFINSMTSATVTSAGDYTWGAQATDGTGSITQGESSWSYIGYNSSKNNADSTRAVVFKAAGDHTLTLAGNIDLGAGSVNIDSGNWTINSADGQSYRLNSAGFIVAEGATLTTTFNGASGDEWRMVGKGIWEIAGSGNNAATLNVGGGEYTVDDNGNVIHQGEVRLNQSGGYAASSIKLSAGVLSVVLMGDGQLNGNNFSFGDGGGLLNLNGHDLSWSAIKHTDSGATIGNCTLQDGTESGAANFTFTGSGTYMGSFTDDGAEGAGQLTVTYNGGSGKTFTLTGSSDNYGGYVVQSGTLKLQGSLTKHYNYTNWSDYMFAGIETSQVTVKSGATLALDHHATLKGNVVVEDGGSFTVGKLVSAKTETIWGVSGVDVSNILSVQGNVTLSGSSSAMTVNTSSAVPVNMKGDISGSGSFTKSGSGTFVLDGSFADSVAKTLSGGTVEVSTMDRLGSGWLVEVGGTLIADNADGSILSHVDGNSSGVVALATSLTTAVDISAHQNVYIGAVGTVDYGTASATLGTNEAGEWRLGGGGGLLNVNFKLDSTSGKLMIGTAASSGTVNLTNTGNHIGSITIGGTGNKLTYSSVEALGGAKITVGYGNELNIQQGNGEMLSIVDKDNSTGVLAIATAEGESSVSNNIDMSTLGSCALGAAGEVTYTGTLTPKDGTYSFGGSGQLTIASDLSGNGNIRIDGQGLSGGNITLTAANTFTGTVTVGGNLSADNGTGSISLSYGVNNALANITTLQLKKNAIVELTGGDATNPVLRNVGTESGAKLLNQTGSRLNATLDYRSGEQATLAAGFLGADINVTKTGAGSTTINANTAFTGTFTIAEGSVTAAGGDNTFGSGTVNIGQNGTLVMTLPKTTVKDISSGYTLANTISGMNITGTGTLKVSSGGTILLKTSGTFGGTVWLTGNTRFAIGAGLDLQGSAVYYNTMGSFQNATVRVDSGSQALVTSQLTTQSSVSARTVSTKFEIAGNGFDGTKNSNQPVDQTGCRGALEIDCGCTVTGQVTLLADASISSYWSNTSAYVFYSKNAAYGNLTGLITGEGKTLTRLGNGSLNIKADNMNTYGNLVISGSNSSTGYAMSLYGGAQKSGTYTALGTGKVTLNSGLVLRFNNSGTVNSGVTYTYANDFSVADGATLDARYNVTELTGKINLTGSSIKLLSANSGTLKLTGGLVGTGKTATFSGNGSFIQLGASAENQFTGTINTAARAQLTLLNNKAVNSSVTLNFNETLNLFLTGAEAYTVGSIVGTPATDATTTALNLNYDFVNGRALSSLTAGTLTATGGTISLTLNEFNEMHKGEYLLLGNAVTDGAYTLSSTYGDRASLFIGDKNYLYLRVTADDSLVWKGGVDSQWDTTTKNWTSEAVEGTTTFATDSKVVFDDTATNRNVSLSSAVTADTVTVKGGVTYTLSGNGSLTATNGLTVGQQSGLNITGVTTSGAATVTSQSTLSLSNAAHTGDIAVSDGSTLSLNNESVTGAATITGSTLSLTDATSAAMTLALSNATVAVSGTNTAGATTLTGNNGFTGSGKLTLASATIQQGTTTTTSGATIVITDGQSAADGGRIYTGSTTLATTDNGVFNDSDSYYGITGTLNIGTSGSSNSGKVLINGIRLSNGAATASTLNVNSGSTLVVTGTTSSVDSTDLSEAGSVMLSHWTVNNAVNVAGTLTINSWVSNWDGTADINVNAGGTLNMLAGLGYGTSGRSKTITLNVRNGGRLNANGGQQNSSLIVNLQAGSTLGIGKKDDTTTAFIRNNMSLGTASTVGTVTVDTQVQQFDGSYDLSSAETAGTVSLLGNLTDAGTTTLAVKGSGTLNFGASAALSGGLTAAGTARVQFAAEGSEASPKIVFSAKDSAKEFGLNGAAALVYTTAGGLSIGGDDTTLYNANIALNGTTLEVDSVDIGHAVITATGENTLELSNNGISMESDGGLAVADSSTLSISGNALTAVSTQVTLGNTSALKLGDDGSLYVTDKGLSFMAGSDSDKATTLSSAAGGALSLDNDNLSISNASVLLSEAGEHSITASLTEASNLTLMDEGTKATLQGTQSLGTVEVDEGTTLTVADTASVTLSSTIFNAGTLNLDAVGYTMVLDEEAMPESVYGDSVSGDTENGFIKGWYFVRSMSDSSSTSLAEGAKLTIGSTVYSLSKDGQDIMVIPTGSDSSLYYVNTEVTYGTGSCLDTNTAVSGVFLRNDGTLNIAADAAPTTAGFIRGAGKVVLNNTVKSTVFRSEANDSFALSGEGTLVYSTNSSATALPSSINLSAEGWTGTVQLLSTTTNRWAGLNIDNYGVAGSTVELKGITAYLGGGTTSSAANSAWGWINGADKTMHSYETNLKLTNNGTTAALTHNDGSSNNVYNFTGSVSGEGNIVYSGGGADNMGLVFSGDVSGWSGTFTAGAGSKSYDIVFTDKATTVKANVYADQGSLDTVVRNADDVTFAGNITGNTTAGKAVHKLVTSLAGTKTFNGTVDVDTIQMSGGSAVFNGTANVRSSISAGGCMVSIGSAGSMSISGTNTVGNLTNGGTLTSKGALTVTNYSGSGTVSVADGASLTLTNGTLAGGGSISGALTLTNGSEGIYHSGETLVFEGNGSLQLGSGTYSLGTYNVGSISGSILDGSAVTLAGLTRHQSATYADGIITISAVTFTDTWNGTEEAHAWNSSDSNWLTNGSAVTYADGDSVLFDGTAASKTVSMAASVSANAMTVNDAYSFEVSSGTVALNAESLSMGTAGSFTKTGAGTLQMSSANATAARVAVSEGTLELTDGTTDDLSALSAESGATLKVAYSGEHTLTLSDSFHHTDRTLSLASGSAKVALGADVAAFAAVNLGSNAGLALSGAAGQAVSMGNVQMEDGATLSADGLHLSTGMLYNTAGSASSKDVGMFNGKSIYLALSNSAEVDATATIWMAGGSLSLSGSGTAELGGLLCGYTSYNSSTTSVSIGEGTTLRVVGDGSTTSGLYFDQNRANTFTVNGTLELTGNVANSGKGVSNQFNIGSTGTLALSKGLGSSADMGTVNVSGTLALGGQDSAAGSSTVNLKDGATVKALDAQTVTKQSFNYATGASVNLSAETGKSLELAGDVNASKSNLRTSGEVILSGTGTVLSLAADNGTASVSGTLTVAAGGSLSGVANSGSITFSGNGSLSDYSGSGSLTLAADSVLSTSGSVSLSGVDSTASVNNSGVLTLSGSISLSSISGAATVNGALTLTGSTYHSGGALTFAQGSSLALGSGTLSYGSYTVGSISGSILGADNRVTLANLADGRVATYYAETGVIKVTDELYSVAWNGTADSHTWDYSTSDWKLGSSDKPFTKGSNAAFDGTGYETVTLADSIEVGKLSLSAVYNLEVSSGSQRLTAEAVDNNGGSFTKTGEGTLNMTAATAEALHMQLSAGTLALDTLSGGTTDLSALSATGGTLALAVTSGQTADVQLGSMGSGSTVSLSSGAVSTAVAGSTFAGVNLASGTEMTVSGAGQAVAMGTTTLNGSAKLALRNVEATTALSYGTSSTIDLDNATLHATNALNTDLNLSGKGTLSASGSIANLSAATGSDITLDGGSDGLTVSSTLTADQLRTTGKVTLGGVLTIDSTIMNSGALSLNTSNIVFTKGDAFAVNDNGAYNNTYSDGKNGYLTSGCIYLVRNTGNAASIAVTGTYYTVNSKSYTYVYNISSGAYMYVSGAPSDSGTYYVNDGTVNAPTGASDIALRGGTLNLNSAPTDGVTLYSLEDKASTVNIASGVTLDMADLNVQQGSVALKLGDSAAISDAGVTYTAKDATSAFTATAAGLSATNAVLTVGAGATGDMVIDGDLTNADLINSSTYTLSETNAANDAFGTVHAEAGDIVMLNKATEVSISDLTIGAGHTLSVSSAASFSEATEGRLIIDGGSLTAGSGARLNADITVSNATVSLAQGGLAMGSTLTLSSGNTYTDYDAAVAALAAGSSSYTLFTGVDSLVIGGSAYSSPVEASSVFSNITSGLYNIVYSGAADGTVALAYATPEPATTTLSLLALAGLCARRRRRCA